MLRQNREVALPRFDSGGAPQGSNPNGSGDASSMLGPKPGQSASMPAAPVNNQFDDLPDLDDLDFTAPI